MQCDKNQKQDGDTDESQLSLVESLVTRGDGPVGHDRQQKMKRIPLDWIVHYWCNHLN